MIKVFVTGAVISNGYNGAAAIKYSENRDSLRFRFGEKVYDPKAEDNCRWINLTAKAFGTGLCEKFSKMKLDAGSYVNLIGRLDEDHWVDSNTGEKNLMVVIVDEIEYSGGGKPKDDQKSDNQNPSYSNGAPNFSPPEASSDNFTGFEQFEGENLF
jgi:hypothetical protein